MKKAIIGSILLILVGVFVTGFLRGGRVIVIGPGGAPIEGAQVWVSYVSAPAILQGVTDAKGRATIPAKIVRRGGWHSIIASWKDPKGRSYHGQNFEDTPTFPLTIKLTKR
jgi:hypothetical protein